MSLQNEPLPSREDILKVLDNLMESEYELQNLIKTIKEIEPRRHRYSVDRYNANLEEIRIAIATLKSYLSGQIGS